MATDDELFYVQENSRLRYILRGTGNVESYCSCSYDAGRKMSRLQARKTFKLSDLAAQTEGVECRKDDAILNEIQQSRASSAALSRHDLVRPFICLLVLHGDCSPLFPRRAVSRQFC